MTFPIINPQKKKQKVKKSINHETRSSVFRYFSQDTKNFSIFMTFIIINSGCWLFYLEIDDLEIEKLSGSEKKMRLVSGCIRKLDHRNFWIVILSWFMDGDFDQQSTQRLAHLLPSQIDEKITKFSLNEEWNSFSFDFIWKPPSLRSKNC